MFPLYYPFLLLNAYSNQIVIPTFYYFPQQSQSLIQETSPSIKQQEFPSQSNRELNQHQSARIRPKFSLGFDQLKQQSYTVTKRLWSEQQDKLLIHLVQDQNLNWRQISKILSNRNSKMCYNRYKRLLQAKKHIWTRQQDEKLKFLVEEKKTKWKHLEVHFINRKAKQLRERYLNFLRPHLTRQPWTPQEDLKLIECLNLFGKKWKKIERILTNRSENQIKNRFYGRIQQILKKKQTISMD